jgi:ATP synthase protein I
MSPSRKPWRAYGRYGTVGLELILSIGLGYYLGKWADDHFHAHGWLSGAGFFVGCYAGFKALWVTAKRMQKDVERDEAQDRGEDPWAKKTSRDDGSDHDHEGAADKPGTNKHDSGGSDEARGDKVIETKDSNGHDNS